MVDEKVVLSRVNKIRESVRRYTGRVRRRAVFLPAYVFASALLAGPAVPLLARPVQGRAPGASFEVVPGERFGPIRETTTRSALAAAFPSVTIRDMPIEIGEGFCTDGTRLFPGTADEIDVAWQNAERSRVAFVRTTTPGGRWATPRGVRLGTLLSELERLSGAFLTVSGFGWDYGGGTSWSEPTGSIGLRLDFDSADREKASLASNSRDIFGDTPVRSDHPLIRTLRIRVDEMTLSWGPHFNEKDCR